MIGPRALCLLLALLAGCPGDGGGAPAPPDAGRIRRRPQPPPGTVRSVPPFRVDAHGIGAFHLDVTQAEIFRVLPSSPPRVALLDVDDVVDASVVRAWDDQLLVGGRPDEKISFIAAVTPGIAITAEGLAVGASRAQLAELGPPLADPRRVGDPRIVTPASMPNARYLLADDRVVAILLVSTGAPPAPPPGDAGVPVDAGAVVDGGVAAAPPARPCVRKAPGAERDVIAASGLRGRVTVAAACLGGADGEAVVVGDDAIAVVAADGARPRRIAGAEARDLVWAAPLADEDHDEIVAVVERRGASELEVSLVVFRVDSGRLLRVAEDTVYRLTRHSAQWIGAELDDLQLLITVTARADGFEVGGVLLQTAPTGVTNVAPLIPQPVARRRRTSAEPAGVAPQNDAAPADAGVTPTDASL